MAVYGKDTSDYVRHEQSEYGLVEMAFLLLTIAILIVFFVIRGMVKPARARRPDVQPSFGIPMTEKEIESERDFDNEVMKLLEDRIVASGYFKKEKIAELMANLNNSSVPFGRTNTKIAFDGNTFLTVEEKRALGLNTRMKYSKKFIAYFDAASFTKIEPKATLECMHLDAFHRVSRKREFLKLRNLGFVRQVKIVPFGDEGDCAKVKRLKKVYAIEVASLFRTRNRACISA
jgi:hypothetical protein